MCGAGRRPRAVAEHLLVWHAGTIRRVGQCREHPGGDGGDAAVAQVGPCTAGHLVDHLLIAKALALTQREYERERLAVGPRAARAGPEPEVRQPELAVLCIVPA